MPIEAQPLLVIMVKAPRPGVVKTRLAACLPLPGILDLYRCLLGDTIALAQSLNVAFEPVAYQRMADVIEGMKAGEVDFTISHATLARARDVAFSQTLLTLELGYLVMAAAAIATALDVDKPGMRIGVTQGATSERTLPKILTQATVVPAQNLDDAIAMLARGELDGFATNKPTLFAMSDAMPGLRILDGRWGVEPIAVAIPKGRNGGLDHVRRFVKQAQSSGLLRQAMGRARLRGIAAAEGE